jgi:hypothetical protein
VCARRDRLAPGDESVTAPHLLKKDGLEADGNGAREGQWKKRKAGERKTKIGEDGFTTETQGDRAERSGQVAKWSSERWEAVKAGVTSIDIAIT